MFNQNNKIMTTKTKVSTTICSLEDILFPVELRDNERKTNREYSKVVTGIVNGEEIDLNYCSPVYELIPNENIFPKIEEVLRSRGIAFTAQYSHTNYARFYAKYIIEDPRFAYIMKGTNDMIKFIWYHQHSYNGLTKYKGLAGFYRVVCSNGLVIPVAEMNEYNLSLQGKHTEAILHTLEEFNKLFMNLINNLGVVKTGITEKYEVLGGRWVAKPEDRLVEVLKATNIAMIDNSKFNTVNDILNRINKEANDNGLGYNGRVNDWLIYNGINQYVNDNSLNIAAPEKRRETDSKVLQYMLEYPA